MFVGEKAAENIPGAAEELGKAKQKADAGENMPHIFKQTNWFQGEDCAWRREIADDKAELTGKLKKGNDPIRLDEALKHDELFEADPSLRNTKAVVQDEPGLAGGMGELPNGDPVVFVENPNDLKTLLHEEQHDIQFKHGLTPGTTVEQEGGDAEAYKNNLGERESRDVERRINDRDSKPDVMAARAGGMKAG